MTDKQIKQAAELYAELLTGDKEHYSTIYTAAKEGFEAGAYGRDREVMDLEHLLKVEKFTNKVLTEANEKLRNPWISVKDRLPENNCVVFVSLDGTEYLSAHYRAKSKRFITVSKDKQTLVEVRKSSATYTTCGDCIKEERLYSEGQREDITDIVTHWMPIPELKKE